MTATGPTRARDRTAREESVKHQLQVQALESGTVIDHLAPGTALRTVRLLDLPPDARVLVGANLPSRKLGLKDLVKVDGRELTREEISKVALLSPEATLSIIRDYEVVRKVVPELPDTIEGLVACANPACITQDPRVASRFVTESRQPLRLRCYYCERSFSKEEIEFL